MPTTDEKAWKVALGLAEDVRILESYFKRLADGELLNVDNKRNVAVRTDTLLSLMNSLRQFERENLEKLGYSATDIDDWILEASIKQVTLSAAISDKRPWRKDGYGQ